MMRQCQINDVPEARFNLVMLDALPTDVVDWY
jgi:hypothetical protein